MVCLKYKWPIRYFLHLVYILSFLSSPAVSLVTNNMLVSFQKTDFNTDIAPIDSLSSSVERETIENLPNNAPLKSCGSAAGVEDGVYADIFTQYMDPLCEDVQGYCRLKRNTNYTAILRFTPKVHVHTLSVRVSLVQPGGWGEALFWPEYSACNRFNISCPHEVNVPIYAHNEDQVPNEAPPTRGLFRLRLLGTSSEDDTKKIFLCRQVALQLY